MSSPSTPLCSFTSLGSPRGNSATACLTSTWRRAGVRVQPEGVVDRPQLRQPGLTRIGWLDLAVWDRRSFGVKGAKERQSNKQRARACPFVTLRAPPSWVPLRMGESGMASSSSIPRHAPSVWPTCRTRKRATPHSGPTGRCRKALTSTQWRPQPWGSGPTTFPPWPPSPHSPSSRVVACPGPFFTGHGPRRTCGLFRPSRLLCCRVRTSRGRSWRRGPFRVWVWRTFPAWPWKTGTRGPP